MYGMHESGCPMALFHLYPLLKELLMPEVTHDHDLCTVEECGHYDETCVHVHEHDETCNHEDWIPGTSSPVVVEVAAVVSNPGHAPVKPTVVASTSHSSMTTPHPYLFGVGGTDYHKA
jgi:hypothetical protein